MTASQKGTLDAALNTLVDELDAHVAESMQDPEFRAASEDVDHRYDLIEALVALRKRLGLTQKDVASRMGVKQPTVSGFETEGSDPRLSTIQRYARAVQAHARVVVQVSLECDWVKPTMSYDGEVSKSISVGGSRRDWPKRTIFDLAA